MSLFCHYIHLQMKCRMLYVMRLYNPLNHTQWMKKIIRSNKGTSYNVNGIQLEIKDLPGQNGVGCFITEVLSDGSETQAWAFVELRKETENTYILSIKETGGRVLEIEIPKDDIGKGHRNGSILKVNHGTLEMFRVEC